MLKRSDPAPATSQVPYPRIGDFPMSVFVIVAVAATPRGASTENVAVTLALPTVAVTVKLPPATNSNETLLLLDTTCQFASTPTPGTPSWVNWLFAALGL